MTRYPTLTTQRPRLRGLLGVTLLFFVSSIGTSCITPDFTFEQDRGDGDDDGGGDGDGDGDQSASGGSGEVDQSGGATGDGDNPLGGSGSTPDHCENQVRDMGETDVDCGADCEPCRVGRACDADDDCENESCVGGTCRDPSCDDGEQNFGETDTDCGGENCGATCHTGDQCDYDADCVSGNCLGSVCQERTCDDRIQNGAEVGVDCGGPCEGCPVGEPCVVDDDCEAPPEGDPAAAQCSDLKVCELQCPDDTGDCNQRANDGCESDLLTSGNHCGACGERCNPSHAVGICFGGECLIKTDEPNQGCDENYANCNFEVEDGCEVNLMTDRDHCSGCDLACSAQNGVPDCGGGECSISCSPGFEDCDANARLNGCEVSISSNAQNCGECGEECGATDSTQTPFCAEGMCGETECDEGMGDCDGDGTCSNSLTTADNCGACGRTCSVAHGAASCSGSVTATCEVESCASSSTQTWANCDASYETGCEVDVESSNLRCGGCLPSDATPGSGQNCAAKVGTENVTATSCSQGSCRIIGCTTGYADCNGEFGNGCDTHLLTDAEFCGSCRTDCTDAVGTNNVSGVRCATGSCAVNSCNAGRADCDGSFSNGCEMNTGSSPIHCGGCNPSAPRPGSGENCEAAIGSDSIASVSCGSGECSVASCSSSTRADCDGDFDNGCEVNTSSNPNHCGDCYRECGAKTNASGSCESAMCRYTCHSGWVDADGDLDSVASDGCETRELVAENTGTFAFQDTSTGTHLTVSHTLGGAAGTERLVVVGVACKGNNVASCTLSTAKYGNANLELLGRSSLHNQQLTAIYYLLDSDLPSPGMHLIDLATPTTGYGALAAEVIELSGAEQSTFPLAQGTDTGGNCGSTVMDGSVPFSNLPPGTILYGVAGGFGASGSSSAYSPLVDSTASKTQNDLLFGSGISMGLEGSATAAIELTGCNASTFFAVAIRPESND